MFLVFCNDYKRLDITLIMQLFSRAGMSSERTNGNVGFRPKTI